MKTTQIQKALVLVSVVTGVFAAGCELIVDFDRTKIPVESVDSGLIDGSILVDGSVTTDGATTDDAAADASEDAGEQDAATDAGSDADAS